MLVEVIIACWHILLNTPVGDKVEAYQVEWHHVVREIGKQYLKIIQFYIDN